MTYGSCPPTVYAVFFLEINVAKIGFTEGMRWRTFIRNGATLVATEEFDNSTLARIFEKRTHNYLRSILPPGFASPAEAAPHIRAQGAGWSETYSVPTAAALLSALRSMPYGNGGD